MEKPSISGMSVVHLERSRTSRAFAGEESLWADELDQIYDLIDQHVAALDAEPRQRGDEHSSRDRSPLLSIAIFGTSGSGKTSLLKTLRSEVNSSRYRDRRRKDGHRSPTLRSLPIIEPNILANDEHFLYAFLAAALDEDLKQVPRPERTANALTPLQQEFQNVSEYLQVIDKVEKPLEYDPLGLSLERLERHSSGLLLRQKMWKLLTRLADDLAGKDKDSPSIVLLPVDDADMAFDSLIATLDTFHRYLLHPRIVPIFTFTGRLAEELLRVHFARNLTVAESKEIAEKDDQTPTTLKMAEHMAVQYMVKLFPIRNRVRLGPAPARVQAANYRTQGKQTTEDSSKDGEVWNLLEAASILLFGDPEWPIAPRLRLALRPSTLRRQLQVLDAMHDSRVSALLRDGGNVREIDRKMSWVSIFDDAGWALLNVHRDVLRDFRMHIEELFSLTPHNLSREVLAAILSFDWETRRELIQRWRFQVEDRRGQILSLLALKAFRPQMPGEEPSGDDPDAVRVWSERMQLTQEDMRSFSAMKGLIWFLDLWIGFYLPQILARNRLTGIPGGKPEAGGIRSVGWNLRSGPANAIQEALDNREISATGMMLLHPDLFRKELSHATKEINLALHIWCFYGYKRGKPWVTVSFWRGLGLIGLLLEDYERHKVKPKKEKEALTVEKMKRDRLDRIESVLDKHCATAKIPGSFQEGDQPLGKWDRGSHESREALGKLAIDIDRWLQTFEKRSIQPLRTLRKGAEDAISLQQAFKESFIRRLHGEYLLGELWPDLGGAYLAGPSDQEEKEPGTVTDDTTWNALVVLEKWTKVLVDYWNPRPHDPDHEKNKALRTAKERLPLCGMLTSCPLLDPFLPPHPNEELRKSLEALLRTDREHSPFPTQEGLAS